MSLTCTTVFWGQARLVILPLGSCGGWSLLWQNVASTDEQRDLVQWGIDGSIRPAPGTWHFVTLPQKLIQLKKYMQIQALNIITIYHWKGDQGVYFHLNYTSLNMHQKKKQISGALFQFLFWTWRRIQPLQWCICMKIQPSWMKDSKSSFKMVSFLCMLGKKNSSRHEAKRKGNFHFLFLYIWKLSHFSVRWVIHNHWGM